MTRCTARGAPASVSVMLWPIGCVGVQTVWLARAERDDAANRIVRRDADGHAIARHDFDAKAAHAAAELRQNLVTGVALHAIQTTAVHRDDGALHVDQIVLAQMASVSFLTNIVPHG